MRLEVAPSRSVSIHPKAPCDEYPQRLSGPRHGYRGRRRRSEKVRNIDNQEKQDQRPKTDAALAI